MNSKKLFLLSLLALSTATIRPNEDEMTDIVAATGTLGSDEVQFITAAEQADKNKHAAHRLAWFNSYTMATTLITNVLPGALVGAFTGASIGYLSGKLFDAIVNKYIKSILINDRSSNQTTAIIAAVTITRLGAQIGSKMYWEKPLRHKLMTKVIAELKKRGVEFDEEFMQTVARVFAWDGLAYQVRI